MACNARGWVRRAVWCVSLLAVLLLGCGGSGTTPDVVGEDGGDGGEGIVDDVDGDGWEGREDGEGGGEADDGGREDGGGCETPEDCDDGIECTQDGCDTGTGTCTHRALPSVCDDGDPCTGAEICDVVLGCQAGTPVDCGDGIDCTDDTCDPLTATCRNEANHANCTPPQICDPRRGGCADPPACERAEDCDDGDLCNGVETCGADLHCVPGTPVTCDDSVACTVDTCNQDDGTCAFAPNDAACADDDLCNGGEVCDPTAGCGPGVPVDCDDGVNCTADSCTTATGRCVNRVDDAVCDDGVFCNGAEACSARSGCGPGTPPSCSDGIVCTTDRCDTATDRCVNVSDSAVCSDGLFCNGAEVCTAGSGCGAGTPRVCDDGIGCTTDSCDPAAAGGTGACIATAPDRDRDTYPDEACTGTDCDDMDPLVHPGAAEGCNAIDDDCDGATDETFGCIRATTRTCSTSCGSSGTQTCSSSCAWGTCAPPAETCNGFDDDCVSGCDNGFECCRGATQSEGCGFCGTHTRTCSSSCAWGTWGSCTGAGVCTAGATETRACLCGGSESRTCGSSCTWGAWSGCTAGACTPGAVQSCTTGCSSTGSQTCLAGCTWGACNPPVETCNGRDDDCVSGCDNGFTCCLGATETASCGSCATQTRTCAAGCAWSAWGTCTGGGVCSSGATETRACACGGSETRTCQPTCMWGAWSGCTAGTCTPGAVQSCNSACGSTGSQACTSSCTWGACIPPAETCNGADDDCVAGCDNGWECCRSATQTQGCGFCGTQTRSCGAACTWGSWSACSGGGVCAPGTVESRACACSGTESRTCQPSCAWGAWSGCGAGACTPGAVQSCTTGCLSTGSQTCQPGCTWGPCNPPAETCNGRDDDCISGCDNGWACCQGATETQICGFCSTGTQSRTCSGACAWSGYSSCVGGGACSPGNSLACTNGCGVGGTQLCSGSCSWGACCGTTEVCGNACDDDCDGLTNEGCPTVPNDTCASPTSITLGGTTTGTITGALHQYTGSCGSTAGPDVVYTFSHGGGDLFIGVVSTAFNPTIYLSTSCGTSTYCNDNAYAGVNGSVLIQNDLAAGTYYLIVDSPTGAAGDFTIETYRNGDLTAGDRCGQPLQLYNGVSGDTCPLWVDNDYPASCQSWDSWEIVYYVVKETPAGTVTVSSCGASYDTVLYIRDDCDSGPDITCNDDNGPSCSGTRASFSTSVGPGIYFVFADGWDSYCGTYTLAVTGF